MKTNPRQNKTTPQAAEEIDVFAKPQEMRADLPFHQPLTATMNVEIAVNPQSQVWVAHDKPLSGIVQWAELDVDTSRLSLIMNDGKFQDTGLDIQPAMRKYLKIATHVDLMLLQNKKVEDFCRVPLVVRESGLLH